MDKKQEQAYNILVQYKAETVLNAFLNFYGVQLLDSEFMQFLVDEGLLPDDNND